MIAFDLPTISALIAFSSASFFLAAVPGPAVVYVLTRTISEGKLAGFSSVIGVALGNLANAIGSAIGLAMLFELLPSSYVFVKYAGAAYLFYLGVSALLKKKSGIVDNVDPEKKLKVLRDGFFVAFLNPKTTLFFASFLPQFISITGSPISQSLFLATMFVFIAAMIDVVYVSLASYFLPKLKHDSKKINLISKLITASAFFFLSGYAVLMH